MDTQKTAQDQDISHLKEEMLLRFRVGPFRFCVPAVEVEGIIVPPELTVIPLNPPHSKGVFIYHGDLASAISLRSKFGLPDHEDNNLGQLILGIVSVGLVAFWVDEVYETVDASELDWRDMPDFVPHDAFESFAARDDMVIMASTMQKLYDVPAEQVSSMLAGVRESFDLPEDVPPVAAESFEVAESGDGEDETFGDLSDPSASPVDNSILSESAKSSPDVAIVGNGQADEDTGAKTGPVTQPGAAGDTAQAKMGTGSAVVDLASHRQSQNTKTGTGNRATGSVTSGGHGTSTGNYSAARTTGSAGGQHAVGRSGQVTGRAASTRTYANGQSGRVAGGTYSSAVNRMRNDGRQQSYSQNASAGADAVTDAYRYDDYRDGSGNDAAASTRSHYYTQNPNYYNQNESKTREDRDRRGMGIWWLLAAVLLLLVLLAYWLWPTEHRQEPISTIPNQNYRQPYNVSPPPAPAEPVNEPEPVANKAPEPAPKNSDQPANEASTMPANEPVATASVNTADSSAGKEVYRLEGEQVTVTVERGKSAATPATEPQAVIKTGDIAPAYTEFVHTVVKGDTLWDIAAKYLKNPFRYPELAELSRIENPDLIYPGDTVRIRKKN